MAKDRTDAPAPDGINLDAISMPRALRDFIELNNEYAERDTGRVKRFLVAEHRDGTDGERKKKDERFARLLNLLQNPDYARAYFALEDLAERAGMAVDAALAENALRMDEARDSLEAISNAAPELADGRKLFRGVNGRVYAEDGTEITDLVAVATAKSAPRWEEFQRVRDEIEKIADSRRKIEGYQRNVLEPAQEALTDVENPREKDELEQRARDIHEKMPDEVRASFENISAPKAAPQISAAGSPADDYLGSSPLNAPDVSGAFKTAREDAYASSSATPLPTTGPKLS